MASMIKSCFQPVLILDLYARSEIDVYVIVLQVDGGLLATAINATTMAFIDAGYSSRFNFIGKNNPNLGFQCLIMSLLVHLVLQVIKL